MIGAVACIVPCIIRPHVDHTRYVADHTHWWQVMLLVIAVMVFIGCVGWLMDKASGYE